MQKSWFQTAIIVMLSAGACHSDPPSAPTRPLLRFEVQELQQKPVLDQSHPDAADNKYGFEDGVTFKINGIYHMIVDEMAGDPFWVRMRIAHWTSPDALHWKRQATLKESSGKPRAETGLPYESVWGPTAAFDTQTNHWNLFYVAYDQGGAAGGRIWRAESSVPGQEGIGGPYKDIGIIMQPDQQSQPWEGAQGVDSFFPYHVGNRWMALYGSHAVVPVWPVGEAEGAALSGPWTRLPTGNPLSIEPIMVENPIVTQVDGLYLMVYDTDVISADYKRDAHNVGFSYSTDGIRWASGGRIEVQPDGPANWSSCIRTPLGLVAEGHDIFTLLYTAELRGVKFWPVGMVRLKLVRPPT